LISWFFCIKTEEHKDLGDALYRRASPLQKQSTGLFLNSPLAELPPDEVFRRLRTTTKALPLETASL